MRRFILKIVLFGLVLVFVDFVLGLAISSLARKAKSGHISKTNHVVYGLCEDIMVMGSSRAAHHYVPSVIEQNGYTCYNAGVNGNGIVLMYGLLGAVEENRMPRVLIYDVSIGFDLLQGDNNKYLGHLKKYYDIPHVQSVFDDVDFNESLKMYSSLYRYNSDVVSVVANYIFTREKDYNGFVPLYGSMSHEPQVPDDGGVRMYDSLKISYLERMIVDYRDKCRLIFAISPMFFERDDDIYQPIVSLCNKYSVPLLNHNNDTAFIGKRKYFKDGSHLNNDGAVEYSKRIALEIEPYIR